MAQQQNQIAGFSTNYFHKSPPPQNSHPQSNDQSNSRKRPRILGGNRKIRETVEEKRIRITEENLAEAEKIKEATRVSKPHRAIQTAYHPFMGNMTDSEKEEEALSDEEMVENVDPYYEDLSRKQDMMFQLSRLPPPAFGEDATAELPGPQRVFVPVNEIDWPPLDALDGIEEAYAPGTLLSRQLAESFKETTPTQEQENVNKELKKTKKSRRRVISISDRSATKSPPAIRSEFPKLVQKVNTPDKPPVEFKRQDSVGSQSSTSSQGSSSAKRSRSKKKEINKPPLKVSDLENLGKLKMFLNNVVDKENEELYRQKRGPKNQPSELLVGLLNEANCL